MKYLKVSLKTMDTQAGEGQSYTRIRSPRVFSPRVLQAHFIKGLLALCVVGLTACGGGSGGSEGNGSSSTSSASSSTTSTSSTSSTSSSTSSSSTASSSTTSSSTTTSSSSTSTTSRSSGGDNGLACQHEMLTGELSNSEVTLLQAEYYDTCAGSWLDTTEGNSGGQLRTDSVDIIALETEGHAVTDVQATEYLEFSVDVETSGLFDITYSIKPSAEGAVAGVALWVNGAEIDNSSVEVQALATPIWTEYTASEVYLTDGPQTLRVQAASSGAAFELDSIEFSYAEDTFVSPEAAVEGMAIGINLGNTLDAFPNEGDWAPAAQEVYFSAYKEAGFRHVRIPATWDDHTADTAPYTVNASRMDRTEQVVDWALAQGYYVILNAHHEHWLKENYGNAIYRDRFDAIWTQIAERFQDKSARLMFEILNEPNGMTVADVDDLNPRILAIIRETNPTRLAVFSGNGYTPVDSLLSAAIPQDDYLIGNFHSYDPWPFGGQCTRSWGTEQDYADLENIYQRANTWSEQHDIPVMVNEFGAAHYDFTAPENVCNQEARLAYLGAHASFAIQYGFGASVWDDGGSFEVYRRGENTWRPAKDVLVAPNP